MAVGGSFVWGGRFLRVFKRFEVFRDLQSLGSFRDNWLELGYAMYFGDLKFR